MTARMDKRFADLRAENRPALITYFMGGDPDFETSLGIMKALPEAGADVIELGMPFSDPMADGPAIQLAGQRALKGGQTLKTTLDLAREFRKDDDATPIVMMGYYNPIYIYGVDKFLDDALAAGVDGLIVVDLPPEMDDELCVPALARGVNFIRLATRRQMASACRPFLKHLRFRLLRIDERYYRFRTARSLVDLWRGRSYQGAYGTAGLRRFWCQDGRSCQSDRCRGGWRGGRFGHRQPDCRQSDEGRAGNRRYRAIRHDAGKRTFNGRACVAPCRCGISARPSQE